MSPVRNNAASLLRPLTARSVVASTLLGMDPPRLSAAALVASGEQFGVAAGTTRVALSRMVDAGELVATANGVYALAGGLLARHARQEQGRHPAPSTWPGQWHIVTVVESGRNAAARAALRVTMQQARMAELREGVWLRPNNLPVPHVDGCISFTATPEEPIDCDQLFGLTAWATTARELLGALKATQGHLRARDADALGETFVIAAAATRHLTLDPLLPTKLLPRAWPGSPLRRAYDAYQRDFAATWRAWYRAR